jgi:hypothetical protein
MNDNMNYDAQDLRIIENSGVFRADANESLYFARQLESIRAKSYDIKRAALGAVALMPVDTSTNAGAEYITYRQYDSVGAAKIIANYADDLPRADVVAKEFTSPIRGIGNSFGYSVQEIRAGAFAGADLTTKKQSAARRAHDETVNRLAWTGDAVSGLPGFLTNPNIPGYVIPAVGTGSSKLFSTKTADQIIADMNGIVNSVTIISKGIHKANELWMPLSQYTYIGSAPRSGTSDTTILEFFRMNNPGVTVKPILELASVANGGLNASTDTMIAADNSIDNYQLNLPMMFMQHPPEKRGLEFVVDCESRFAGVTVEYVLAFSRADSI